SEVECVESRVVQRNAVAPERSPGCEQSFAQRSRQLVERAEAGLGDLLRIVRGELVVSGLGEDDVRAPVEFPTVIREDRIRRNEVAAELDVEPGLLARCAD